MKIQGQFIFSGLAEMRAKSSGNVFHLANFFDVETGRPFGCFASADCKVGAGVEQKVIQPLSIEVESGHNGQGLTVKAISLIK